MLSSALGMSRDMNGFDVSTVGTRWKLTCVSENCGTDVLHVVRHAAQDRIDDRLLRLASYVPVAVQLLDPFQIDDRHDANEQVGVTCDIDLVSLDRAMRPFVEQQVCA